MKRFTILLAFLVFVFSGIHAQTTPITGNVTSAEDGTPLPGVSVVVQGTTIGTVTDFNGDYSLSAPADAGTLVFSFIGMMTKEVPINNRTTIDVELESDVVGLEEVLVVAYGVTTREGKTGSVTQVETQNLAETPVVSIDKALSGKVPGLMVSTSGGQPGSNSSIRIRGTSSINAGNEPLYVIDGIPVMTGDQTFASTTSNALYALNPSDIESITVLKDAAAASVYGSRAANGVILVTTKTGKSGEAVINFRASGGFSQLANDNNFRPMNSEEAWTYLRAGIINDGRDPDNPEAYGNTYLPRSLLAREQTNWFKEGLRTGLNQKYEFTVRGGTKNLSNYVSAAYEDIEGIVIGNNYNKLNFRANSNLTINEKVNAGTRIAFSNMENQDVSTGGLAFLNPFFGTLNILPWTPFKNEDGSYNTDIPENNNTNPIYSAQVNEATDKQFRFQGTGFLEFKPIEQITIKTNNSYELTNGRSRQFGTQNTGWVSDAVYTTKSDFALITSSNTVSYRDIIAEKNSLNIIAGQEVQYYRSSYLQGESPNINLDIPYPTTSTQADDIVGYSETEWSMLSFFGILDYSFDSKYYLQASIRTDGSSRFGRETRFGTFWSVGASWNMHNESFISDNISALDLAKLRLSYGVNGNNNIGNYLQYGVYGTREYNAASGLAPDQLSNPFLTWELNKTYDIGLDLVLWGRLNVVFDYYDRTTEDMLLNDQLSRTTGFASITRNVGSLKNTGQELSLSGDAVRSNDLNITLGVNFSHNKSEILDLAGEEEIGSYRVYKVGSSLYTFKLHDYAGVNPVNGEALWRDEDGRLTNNYSKSRQIYGGSPEPTYHGGGFLEATWKGFSLNASFDYKADLQIDVMNEGRYLRSDGYNGIANHANTSLDYWQNPGDITETPKPVFGNASESNAFTSTRWLEDGSYTRIKEVTIAYNLPKTLLIRTGAIDNFRIYLSGYNLYTFHSLNTFDPERGTDGHAYGIYPTPRRVVAGIEVTF